MENDIGIELQESAEPAAGGVQLPLNFISVGEIAPDDVKVYIKQDVYKQLEKLAASDTKKELGSILFGGYCEAHGKMQVVISACIEAKYTDASASTLTFTHETWDYINREQAVQCPELKMLGWQHTHPNYGIFLSNYDMFIQENFFNLPFQVAYVIDPIQNIRGFFQWKSGKVEKLHGFYIYDEIGKLIKIEQSKPTKKAPSSSALSKPFIVTVFSIFAVFGVLTYALLFSLNNQLNSQSERQTELQGIIAAQDSDIKALQNALTDGALTSEGPAAIEALIQRLEASQPVSDNQKELLAQLKGLLEEDNGNGNAVEFVPYTVIEGDCLSDICSSHGLDYGSNIRIIKALNGITDVNSIYVGQVIILPMPQTQS